MKQLYRIFTTILLVQIFATGLTAQCTVQLNYSDTINVCLNSELTISTTASSGTSFVLYSDTFSTAGPSSTMWASVSTGVYTNPCSLYSGNPTPQAYYWTGTSLPRMLESNNLDLTNVDSISFDYAIGASQGGAMSCERPDLNFEGLGVEYSIDNGLTWIYITYLAPDGTIHPNMAAAGTALSLSSIFDVWDTYSFPMPLGAKTTSTKLRWIQVNTSSPIMDNWGIDNIQLTQNAPITNYSWNVSADDTSSINYTVTGDTIVDLLVTNSILETCSASFFIDVSLPTVTLYNDTFCIGSAYSLPNGLTVGVPGTYVDTLANVYGCDSIVNTILVGEYQYNAINDTFCVGDNYLLPGGLSVDSAGVYLDTIADISGCKVITTTTLEMSTLCRTITGNAFVDYNANCVFDGMDVYLENKTVIAINNANSNQSFATTDASGNYTINTDINTQEVFLNSFSSLYQTVCFPDT